MLREANNCRFVRDGGWLRRGYRFAAGGLEAAGAVGPRRYAQAEQSQRSQPVLVMQAQGRCWWWYRDRFYWDDDGLTPGDVTALVADRERRKGRKLERARAALVADERAVDGRRERVPRRARLAVWERDGGRCVECGSGFDLQYDHVIPVSLGGATSVENLQLLCGDCNRAKGAALG